MNQYTLIAGVNGTGKSSFRGVLEGQGVRLGRIIDPDLIAWQDGVSIMDARRRLLEEIAQCLRLNASFTQTSLSGRQIQKTLAQARNQGYSVILYYIGLSSARESISRIENRVRKGGHGIPAGYVTRCFSRRWDALNRALPYCDQVIFYDNENGFVKIAEYKNSRLTFFTTPPPAWFREFLENSAL